MKNATIHTTFLHSRMLTSRIITKKKQAVPRDEGRAPTRPLNDASSATTQIQTKARPVAVP
jgi:hypothetical protein